LAANAHAQSRWYIARTPHAILHLLNERALPLEQRRKVKATSTLEVVYTIDIPAATAVSTAVAPVTPAVTAAAAATAPVPPATAAVAATSTTQTAAAAVTTSSSVAAAVTDVPCQHKPAVSTLRHAAPHYLLQTTVQQQQQQQHTLSSATLPAMEAVRQPLLNSSCTASNAAAGTVVFTAVVTPSPLVTAGGITAQHSGVDATLARFGCSSGLADTSSPALRTLPLTLSPAAALAAAAAVVAPTVDDDAEAALQLHNSSNSTIAFMQGLDELAGCDADGGNGALSCGFSLFDGQEHKQSLSRSIFGLFSNLGSSRDYLQVPPLF
jgi:hypothetical protein